MILPQVREGTTSVWHQFVVRVANREDFQQYLEERGVHTLIHYPIPPHMQPCYQSLCYRSGDFPIAEAYADQVVSLPIYNGMTSDEQDYVVDVIKAYFRAQ